MAQTTDALSFTAANVGISTNGSSWTEISGWANSVDVSGGTRQTGAAYTADGDVAIIKAGKREPLTVTARIVYTEPTGSPYNTAQTAYEAGSALYLRWSPGGGDAGDLGFTTSAGIVKEHIYPTGAVDTGDPVMVEIVVECASVTESTIGTAGW